MFPFQRPFGALCAIALALLASAPARAGDMDAAALHAAVAAEQARAPAPRFERGDFIVRQAISATRLSPDGRQVAFIREQGRIRSLWLLPTAGGAPRQVLGRTDAERIDWSQDSRWLLLASSRQLFALAVAGQTGSGLIATLAGNDRRQFAAVDPVNPAAAIVLEQTSASPDTPERWRLLRLDMHGKRTLLHEYTRRIAGFAFDRSGRLAFLQRVEGDALVIHSVDTRGRLRAIVRCEQMRRCSLWPRTDDDGNLLLQNDLEGNLRRLSLVAADGSMRAVHSDPRGEADLNELTPDPATGLPLIASYRSTVAKNYGLTAKAQQHVDAIAGHYPHRNLGIEIGSGADAYWLVSERDGALQDIRWHLYDPRSGGFRDVLDEKPLSDRDGRSAHWLPASGLARKIPFTWRASDGMSLYGFLWVPPGADPATLPLIALVHGGPWNATGPGYYGAGYSQFLVNRGYIVFEPNFRGSTGYGHDYMFAADGDFGNGRVQQDIVDGVRYLLAQDIGDAQRVGIVGASFGGYATLLGVTFNPELFKVGVAFVPPPDFAWDLRWIGRSSEALNLSGYLPYETWLRILSLDLADTNAMARLHAQSPLANAARMNRPLLLVAGGEDHRVAIRGVLGYAAQLKLLGKDVSLLVDPETGHTNQGPIAREASLYLLEQTLHRHLGGLAETPPDNALRDYLKHNLRMP
jgi:dipeptidyl aminopeptidase/acylaminoacyl peptidase